MTEVGICLIQINLKYNISINLVEFEIHCARDKELKATQIIQRAGKR